MNRTLIPLGTLSIASFTSGCGGDPVIGDWEMVARVESYTYSGDDDYCGTYSNETSTTYAGELSVNDQLAVTLRVHVEYQYNYSAELCGQESDSSSYDYNYSGKAEPGDKGEYEITVDGSDGSMTLQCTLFGKDSLKCTSDGEQIDFERN